MKKLRLLFSLLTLSLFFISSQNVFSQTVYGDGNVVKETRTLSSFNSIELNGVMNVFLKQGSNESAVIEADKNIIPYIVTKVNSSGELEISSIEKVDIKKSTKLNVYVTIKDISKLECNGVGNLSSESKLDLNDLEIENNGVGNIDLDVNCNKLELENNSVGNTTLSGNIDNVNIEHNGVGNIKAYDLIADNLKIESNAVGNAEVNSQREIFITLNGMGNVYYKGNASVKKLEKNGFGNVKKM